MPDTGYIELTGFGELEIDPGNFVAAQAIVVQLGTVTNPRVRILGMTDPKTVQYGGSIGIGGEDTDHLGATIHDINQAWVLNRSQMVFTVPTLWWATGAAYLRYLHWWLPPGCSWWALVAW